MPKAVVGPTDAKLSPEMEAAREAAAVESLRAKEEAEARISRENQEQQHARELITGVDSKELSPDILAARKAAAAESQRAKDEAQAKIDAENREMRKRLAEASGGPVGKGRAGWSKIGATVRFMQAASFPQQREETLPGDALAREREREATRARLNPTEALSGAERDYWQAQAPSAFAAAGATLEIQKETRPMSAPLQGASPPTTPPTPPTAPTAHEEMRPRSSPVRSAREMRNWVRTGNPFQDASPTVPSRGPPTQGPPRSLSASGLKYNPQSGMWQKLSLADVALAAAERDAPRTVPLDAGAPLARGAPGTLSLDALLDAKPRGKPPSFGGLSSSGLKFDPLSGLWLPPGTRRPPLGKPPKVGGLSSGGFPGLRCERTLPDPSRHGPRTNPALAPTLSPSRKPVRARIVCLRPSQVRPEEWLLAAARQGAERCHTRHAAAGRWPRLGRAQVRAAS